MIRWTELLAADCRVVCVDDGPEHENKLLAVQIKHPALKRSVWFRESNAGNFFWKNTAIGEGYYIIVGTLDTAIPNAPRRVYA